MKPSRCTRPPWLTASGSSAPTIRDTLNSRNNLAYAYESAGRLDQAVALFEATLADCERFLGGDHPWTRIVRGNLTRLRRR